MEGDGIRPLSKFEDFGDAFTPELPGAGGKLRARVEKE